MELLPGVTSHTADTSRLSTHWLEHGDADGIPVLLVHGNLSTGRFFEQVMSGAPSRFRFIAPDMRGFGHTDALPIDATRGLADWADDLAALLRHLQINRPVHVLGWSAGGLAISQFALTYGHEFGLSSLTYLCPVSPYGYGATTRDGSSATADYAGSGGGGANPDLVQRLHDGDTSEDSPFSIRNVINHLYWNPLFKLEKDREDLLVDEILLTAIGQGTYPGDATESTNWPGFAPGTSGILNALSPAYANWANIADLSPKPPILWTWGGLDLIISDNAVLDLAVLGAQGIVPGWPGAKVYPVQPMIGQTRDVLALYSQRGGQVQEVEFKDAGHAPFIDSQAEWTKAFIDFLDQAEKTA